MTTHPPWSPFPGPSLRFLFLLHFYHPLRVLAYQITTTIENTDPRISYLPSVCNSTGAVESSTCNDPWYVGLCTKYRFILVYCFIWFTCSSRQVVAFQGATSGTVTSTLGPTSAGGNLIPQLFLVLRGASFVLTTSSLSNATANVTILASPSNVFVSTTFNSSAGSISSVGLPPDQDVTLALTYIQPPDGEATRLDIDSVVVLGEVGQR